MEYSIYDNIGLFYDKNRKSCIFLDRLFGYYNLNINYKINYNWNTIISIIKTEIEWYINCSILNKTLPSFNEFIFKKIKQKTSIMFKPYNDKNIIINFN